MRETKTSLWIASLTFGLALGVAALDVFVPAQALPWYGLYAIPVIWMALWSAEDDVFPITLLAVIVSLFAILRPMIPFGETSPIAFHDRSVLIVVIWSTVLLAVLRKRARKTFRWINLAGKR